MKKEIVRGLFSGAMFLALLAAMTQIAGAMPHDCPDGGSASVAMVLVCSGLAAARRYVR
jgi:hypothetical protein